METKLQLAVCKYIRMQYPQTIFRSDQAGLWMPGKAKYYQKYLQSGNGYPDLFIAEAKDKFHGFFLEIKEKKIIKLDGSYVDERTERQARMISQLVLRGYWADFGVGFEECINKIDNYMNL